jgi:thioredoxin 1
LQSGRDGRFDADLGANLVESFSGNRGDLLLALSHICTYISWQIASFRYGRILEVNIGKDFSMSAAAQVTDSTFEQEVLESEVPVLVDFWAPWCGPCRMVAPIVDEIAAQYENQVKVVKVNTDENPNVASRYGIRSIPTLMIFKGGQRVDMVVGAVPKTTLSNTLEKHLG